MTHGSELEAQAEGHLLPALAKDALLLLLTLLLLLSLPKQERGSTLSCAVQESAGDCNNDDPDQGQDFHVGCMHVVSKSKALIVHPVHALPG